MSRFSLLLIALSLFAATMCLAQPRMSLSVQPPDNEGTYWVSFNISGFAPNSPTFISSNGQRFIDGAMQQYENEWAPTGIQTDGQGNTGFRASHKEWGRYHYMVRDEQGNVTQATIEYDAQGRKISSRGQGLNGSWRDSNGMRWQIQNNFVTVTLNNQTVLQGPLTPVTNNRYTLNSGNAVFTLIINNITNNTINLTMNTPDGRQLNVDLSKQEIGGEGPAPNPTPNPDPQPAPTGDWDYLSKLHPASRIGAWQTMQKVNFQGEAYSHSYQSYNLNHKGAFVLGSLRRPNPKMLEITLGANDETPADLEYQFEVRVDARPPQQYRVQLRQPATLRIPVEGVGRIEIFVPPWRRGTDGAPVLVEPKVYY